MWSYFNREKLNISQVRCIKIDPALYRIVADLGESTSCMSVKYNTYGEFLTAIKEIEQ